VRIIYIHIKCPTKHHLGIKCSLNHVANLRSDVERPKHRKKETQKKGGFNTNEIQERQIQDQVETKY
jgi:hypothetical protein